MRQEKNNNKKKTRRRTDANCGLVFRELTNGANVEEGRLQPGASVPLVQMECSVLVHIKLKCENVFSHVLE